MDANWYGWNNPSDANENLVELYCALHHLRDDYNDLTPTNHRIILNKICTLARLYVEA